MAISFIDVKDDQPDYEEIVLLETSDGKHFTGYRVSTDKNGDHYEAHPELNFDSKIDVVKYARIVKRL